MRHKVNAWALVLAAGDGARLGPLTIFPAGVVVPKQFCSLRQGPSLLAEALSRARAVTDDEYRCVVVAESHRRWWESIVAPLPPDNVIIQPQNRGTANGILLSLLHIVERDSAAHILILPSDHHVEEERLLARSMQHALERIRKHPDDAVLLGMEPEECDPDLGYILPGRGDAHGVYAVRQFVENPSPQLARALIARGSLWNSFVMAATATALLALFNARMAEIVREMHAAVRRDLRTHTAAHAIADLYARLPTIDFSRQVLQGQEAHLQVLSVGHCGWSDLRTPERVARALRRGPRGSDAAEVDGDAPSWSLAAQYEHWQNAAADVRSP